MSRVATIMGNVLLKHQLKIMNINNPKFKRSSKEKSKRNFEETLCGDAKEAQRKTTEMRKQCLENNIQRV